MRFALFALCCAASAFGQDPVSARSIKLVALANPSAPTVSGTCPTRPVNCGKQYAYAVVAKLQDGTTTAVSANSALERNAGTLDSTHYNLITWNSVAGADNYDVYCTVGCSTVGTVAVGVRGTRYVDTTGFVTTATAPTTNTTGGIKFPDGSTQLSAAPSSMVDDGTTISTTRNLSVSGTVTAQGVPLATAVDVSSYLSVLGYKPQTPQNGPLPKIGMVGLYDLTGLAGGTTTVASAIAGGPTLTLNGSPTLGTGAVAFAGATQWAATTTFSGITLGGQWTVILAMNQTSAGGGTVPCNFSFSSTADNTHYVAFYAGVQDPGNKRSTGFVEVKNGTGPVDSVTFYNAPSGSPTLVAMYSDGSNIYLRRLDLNTGVSVANPGGSANPALGIGVDLRAGLFSKTDALSASYAMVWNRVLTQSEIANTYGFLTNYLSPKTVALQQYKRPPLTPVSMPKNGLATLPMMGWDAWYVYGVALTDTLVRANALAMSTNGMQASGYHFSTISAGWPASARDDTSGALVADATKFPSGIKATCDYIHGLGQGCGIYTAYGAFTCGSGIFPGSYYHELQDANTFASWGIDIVEEDTCGNISPYDEDDDFWASSSANLRNQATFNLMAAALRATGRPIVFKIDVGPQGPSFAPFAALTGANAWVSWPDIGPGWSGVDAMFDSQAGATASLSATGLHNDPDNLMAGGALTHTEGQSQFSLWALLAAPLTVGADLTTIDATNLSILTNSEIIAVDQDPLVKQGIRVGHTACGNSYCDTFVRQLTGTNTCAVGFFNRASTAQDVAITASAINSAVSACGAGPWNTVRDLQNKSNLSSITTGYTATAVPSHGSVLIRVAP